MLLLEGDYAAQVLDGSFNVVWLSRFRGYEVRMIFRRFRCDFIFAVKSICYLPAAASLWRVATTTR
jgi:hypothetical protein